MVDPELLKQARRALYVCRLYDPAKHSKSGIEVRRCADCGRGVAVTTTVLRDRMQSAREAKVKLDVVCDGCSETEIANGPAILSFPSPEEIEAANEPPG